MSRRTRLCRSGSSRIENHGRRSIIARLCFVFFLLAAVVFTIETYQSRDTVLPSSTRLANLSSKSDQNFLENGEDFTSFIASASNSSEISSNVEFNRDCEPPLGDPIDCRDPELFHSLIRFTMQTFENYHFYKFGKPVPGSNGSTCDMAWRYRQNNAVSVFSKDYRRFVISRHENCSYSVVHVGQYHSGVNAKKIKKENSKPRKFSSFFEDDSLVSNNKFEDGKYLIYMGGGDRCKGMNHYLWSFLCSLGEAEYLNRTLIMDSSICLSSMYASSGQDQEGKYFQFYFDIDHLKDLISVLDQRQFWMEWKKRVNIDNLTLYHVENFKIAPAKLINVKDTLIMRKFGNVEPNNYWYRVCEGGTESVVRRPWRFIKKSKRLMDIVSSITSKLNEDFDSVHFIRESKSKNAIGDNSASDVLQEKLLSYLQNQIDNGRPLYIATDENDLSFFDPLKERYTIYFLKDFSDLWNENSEWYLETKKLNHGVPVDFDGYMRIEVNAEVFFRGKKQIEVFKSPSYI